MSISNHASDPTTSLQAGSIVLVEFPFFQGAGGSKVRPALVVSRDTKHNPCLMVAPLTSNTTRSHFKNQTVIDPAECKTTGLAKKSAVKCNQLMTITTKDVKRQIGTVGDAVLDNVKAALRFAFAL